MKEATPSRGLLDPKFTYRPSWDTDIRATLERARKAQAATKARASRPAKPSPVRV